MDLTRRSLVLGTAAASTLALAACGGSGDEGGDGGSATIVTDGKEPENPLVPTNTSELGGGSVLTACFACLSYYTADGTVAHDVAESIESEDQQNWTITIRPGTTFSDGSAVTAKSFVDAWNFGALTTNAQRAQSFFEPIEGFEAVAAESPTAETMSGLAVVDDTTFTVKLVSPQSDFPLRLGYWAFAPLPEAALTDIAAFGEKPVSNGPYTVSSWDHNTSIEVVRNPDYDGPRKAENEGVSFVVYSDPETAYNDLETGTLDVLGAIPSSALQTFQDDLGDRAINQPGATIVFITIPQYADADWTGEAGALRRQAISRAIDREAICKDLFFDTRAPATDFVAPAVEGGGATDIPGAEVLAYDADEAKRLWAQAEEISPFQGEFTLDYPADGPNKDWVEAVCNSVRNALGIAATPRPHPAFGEYKQQIAQHQITGPFRSNWIADYPSPFNFLFPLYGSGAAGGKGSNEGEYLSPEFDGLLAEAQQAADPAAALSAYKAAQAVLLRDLPSIPLWYQNVLGGYREGVSDVTFTWNGASQYSEMTKS